MMTWDYQFEYTSCYLQELLGDASVNLVVDNASGHSCTGRKRCADAEDLSATVHTSNCSSSSSSSDSTPIKMREMNAPVQQDTAGTRLLPSRSIPNDCHLNPSRWEEFSSVSLPDCSPRFTSGNNTNNDEAANHESSSTKTRKGDCAPVLKQRRHQTKQHFGSKDDTTSSSPKQSHHKKQNTGLGCCGQRAASLNDGDVLSWSKNSDYSLELAQAHEASCLSCPSRPCTPEVCKNQDTYRSFSKSEPNLYSLVELLKQSKHESCSNSSNIIHSTTETSKALSE
ncbi:hypothetical protein ACA910_006960 [Epithemia clementina (nom. ined.)]